jgi:hypothetical protein
MWIQAGVKKARFPELELYGDVMTEDEQGNDIPEAQGEIPSSWLVGLVPWAVLLLITMALFEVIVVKRFIRKLHWILFSHYNYFDIEIKNFYKKKKKFILIYKKLKLKKRLNFIIILL